MRAWFASTRADELYLSVLTVGEIRRGIERLQRRDAAQAGIFEAWLATLRRDFAQRVLPCAADIADEWGRLGLPDPIPTVDGLLAATARVANLTLVTRNTADLAHTGVRLLNRCTRARLANGLTAKVMKLPLWTSGWQSRRPVHGPGKGSDRMRWLEIHLLSD